MLRPVSTALPTVMVDMVWVLMATDTVPTAMATPPMAMEPTTTARGPLMLRPSPRLRLMPRPTTMVVMDSVPTVATDWELTATDTVPMAMATPPTPDMATTTARGPLMLRLSPRLTPRLTTMAAMATPAMLMATVP